MPRARDLGIPFEGECGPLNAITDVTGVEVGHTTLIEGEGTHAVRTGVTAVLPRGKQYSPVFAGWFSFNGCGELTGTTWVEESGYLESAVLITETSSVGIVRDAAFQWALQNLSLNPTDIRDVFWGLPVVGETLSMFLSDMFGFHIRAEHVFSAINGASAGNTQEGNVGGGTAMICHDFKGGIGTASRRIETDAGLYTLGVLVQANHGSREQLRIVGVPVGLEITDRMPEITYRREPGAGSMIAVLATDAPLLPHQLKRLARRIPIGMGRNGAIGSNSSGDIFIAFSTANPSASRPQARLSAEFLPNARLSPLFEAAIQATEEAIINALVAAQTMVGINGNTVHALPHDRLRQVLAKYNRLRADSA